MIAKFGGLNSLRATRSQKGMVYFAYYRSRERHSSLDIGEQRQKIPHSAPAGSVF